MIYEVEYFSCRDPDAQNKMGVDLYIAPWARYQSYGVGVLFGYILYKCKGQLPINRVSLPP